MTASETLRLHERPPERVAVVRMSAVGDTVRALPVIASLRHAWPESHIAWVIQPGPLGLMRGHPDVSEFLVFRRERGLAGLIEFARDGRNRRYDLVLDLHRALKAGLVTAILHSPLKLGYDRSRSKDLNWLFTTHKIPRREPGHAQDELLEFLALLGLPVRREWNLFLSEGERQARDDFFGRLERPALGVVLRSSRAERDWTLDGYARVLEIAEFDLGLTPVLVGGGEPADRLAAERLFRRTRARPRDALGGDLRRLAWLLDGCSALLAPDTGPLHMAVALDTPTVGLYGYTDPGRTGPYGRFADLVVDRYPHRDGRQPSRRARRDAMDRISVSEVAEKLEMTARDRQFDG